jgi:hypothetical protein
MNVKMLSGMVEPTGDPTTLKKEERAMRPTPEVVRKWSPLVILVEPVSFVPMIEIKNETEINIKKLKLKLTIKF